MENVNNHVDPEECLPSTSAQGMDVPSTSNDNLWQNINMDDISSIPLHLRDEAVQNIANVNVFDQRIFEQGLMGQMEEAANRREMALERKRARRDVTSVNNEIRSVTIEMKSLNAVLQNVEGKLKQNEGDSELKKRILSVKRQQDTLEKHLKKLNAKLKRLQRIIGLQHGNESIETSQPIKQEDETMQWLMTGKTAEEREKLIKLGLMTPFGTFINKEDVPIEKPKTKKVFLDDSSFNEYLSSQQKKVKEHKKSNSTKRTQEKDGGYSPTEDAKKKMENDKKFTPKKRPVYTPKSDFPKLSESESEEETPQKKRKLLKSNIFRDDSNASNYKKRIVKYKASLLCTEKMDDKIINGNFKIPELIWSKLFRYQKTGVRWLIELHQQSAGGILGDEMGLGKTIQIIALLAALRLSRCRDTSVAGKIFDGLGPVLIVTPTTVLHQWVREFHKWYPEIRVGILHDSGSFSGKKSQLIDRIASSNGVLVTSYARARLSIDDLITQQWHYVILDEGHKIRNPNAAVTNALKLFPTPHRLILSGSPVQNNLRELWSLFDFVFPGKLGTLPVFLEQFSIPIIQGGYANASEVQVHTAYKCACKLRDTISPYLLRRMKCDVSENINLPDKNEQVLFCKLTETQEEVYKNFLASDQVESILKGSMKIFAGLIHLRKICNHPDLYTGGPKLLRNELEPAVDSAERFGFWKRSGKMIVIESLLRIWKKQERRVLLFTQSRMMLSILEDFVRSREYSFVTMDGSTNISHRQPLIEKFNKDESIFIFILTTKTGGLGVNLTGASRVVIFDPDWNPSTDAQAQERAWRIGQEKDVTIYRLLTTGTIEEKIYHRQVFKQFLTNRVLKDPRQRRFFKANDMYELFTLGNHGNKNHDDSKSKVSTETSAIFAGTGSEVKIKSSKTKNVVKSNSKNFKPKKNVGSASQKDDDLPNITAQNDTNTPNHNVLTDAKNIELERETKIDTSAKVKEISEELKQENGSTTELDNNKTNTLNQNDDNISKSTPIDFKESLRRAKLRFMKEKEKSSKKKKSKSKMVDGEEIFNLISVKTKKSLKQKEERQARRNTDDYVLEKLFKSAGVHSALKHDVIMQSSNPDYSIVEKEAERVAKEAVRNLKLSRRNYRNPVQKKRNKFGSATKDVLLDSSSAVNEEKNSEKVFAGKNFHVVEAEPDDLSVDESKETIATPPLSAAMLLAGMRMRNHEDIHTQEQHDEEMEEEQPSFSSGGTNGLTEHKTVHDELLSDIRNFIAFQSKVNGQASTTEIMEKFEEKISANVAPIFKSLLQNICNSSIQNGENLWTLKLEYR